MELNLKEENLISVINHSVRELESLREKKNLTIDVKSGKDSLILLFDIQKIIQVIVNLLSNAIKFSDNGKKIIIDVKEEKNR